MKALNALLALGALLSVAAGPHNDPTYSLIWKPTEGQALDYGFSAKITTEGSNVEFLTDIHLKVTKIETNGDYTLETTRDHLKVVTDGQEHEVPDQDENKVDVAKYNARGDKISKDEDDEEDSDPMSNILQQTTDFDAPEKPLKKGDKWSKTVKADEKKHSKAGITEYEVLGEAKAGKLDVVELGVKYHDTEGDHPASFAGKISFELKDMSLAAIDVTVKDAPLDEETRGEVHVTMNRK